MKRPTRGLFDRYVSLRDRRLELGRAAAALERELRGASCEARVMSQMQLEFLEGPLRGNVRGDSLSDAGAPAGGLLFMGRPGGSRFFHQGVGGMAAKIRRPGHVLRISMSPRTWSGHAHCS